LLSSRGNIVVYAVIAVLTVISLVVLFRLRGQFESALNGRVNDLQRVFSSRTLLKTPSDPKIVFGEIEAEAAKYENSGEFGALWVAKAFGTDQRIVYPFYYPAIDAAGIADPHVAPLTDNGNRGILEQFISRNEMVELPLMSQGDRLGTLYVQVNYGALRTVSVVIWTLGGMLATSLAFLATQFRRQEKVISATTIELEEKRRELVRLERLALAGQLSANILHDLKKPVLNIRNEAVEALHPVNAESPVEPAPSIFSRIREQADFFLTILKEGGFDRFVRAQEELEYVDINELLDRSVALVRYEQASVQITKSFAAELPSVLAEPVRVIQVFSNLILNAYQALDGRGTLELTTWRQDSQVVVQITDSGPGIPKEQLDQVFEPFYTTKAPGEGTGLGLYIVQDILRELGGSIELNSEPGKTSFRMMFNAAV
jgi:signal transduction histidine kinase